MLKIPIALILIITVVVIVLWGLLSRYYEQIGKAVIGFFEGFSNGFAKKKKRKKTKKVNRSNEKYGKK